MIGNARRILAAALTGLALVAVAALASAGDAVGGEPPGDATRAPGAAPPAPAPPAAAEAERLPDFAAIRLHGPGLSRDIGELAFQLRAFGVRLCSLLREPKVPAFDKTVTLGEVVRSVAEASGCRLSWFAEQRAVVFWRESSAEEKAALAAGLAAREWPERLRAAWDAAAYSEDPAQIVRVLEAARADQEKLTPKMAGWLGAPDRWEAAMLFGDKPVRDFLDAALRHADDGVRESAAGCLGYLNSQWARQLLRVTATGEHSNVRRAALAGLAESWGKSEWGALLLALEDRSMGLRKDAATYLGRLGGPAAVPLLAATYEANKHGDVRWGVAEGLAEAGGRESVEALVALLKDPDDGQRYLTSAMLECRQPDLAPAMAAVLDDKSERVWQYMFDRLAELQARGPRDLLIARLPREKDPAKLKALREALSRVLGGDPTVNAALGEKKGPDVPEGEAGGEKPAPEPPAGRPELGRPPALSAGAELSDRGKEVLATKLHGPGLAREIEDLPPQLAAAGLRVLATGAGRRLPVFEDEVTVREVVERLAKANGMTAVWRSGGEAVLLCEPVSDEELATVARRLSSDDVEVRRRAIYDACSYAGDPRETVLALRAAAGGGRIEMVTYFRAIGDRSRHWVHGGRAARFGGDVRWAFAAEQDPGAFLKLCRRAAALPDYQADDVRRRALAELARLDWEGAEPILRKLAAHDLGDVGGLARAELIRRKGDAVVDEIAPLLASTGGYTRGIVARSIGSAGGEKARAALSASLAKTRTERRDDDQRIYALEGLLAGLAQTGDAGRKFLVAALDDADPVVRRAAIEEAGILGAAEALKHLTAALGDPDGEVRSAALAGLYRLHTPAARDAIIGCLEKLPKDERAQVREGLHHAFYGDPVAYTAATEKEPDRPPAPPPEVF